MGTYFNSLRLLLLCLLMVQNITAQNEMIIKGENIAINDNTQAPDPSEILDISSTDKGILIPRVQSTILINMPIEGLLVYEISSKAFYFYDGTA